MPITNATSLALLDRQHAGAGTTDSPTTLYAALSTTEPTAAGGNVTEPTDANYARVATNSSAWADAATRAIATDEAIEFPKPVGSMGSPGWLCFFDAASGGNLFDFYSITNPKTISAGSVARFSAGSVVKTVGTAVINLQVQTSRTSGVAPLAVFFDTTTSTATGHANPYFSTRASWNFGDTNSGTWDVDGKSKNTHIGPLAAHVFEDPGTYQVSVTAVDKAGNIATEVISITATDPDTVFAGTDTICFSTDGVFTGKPTGATEVTTSEFNTVQTYIAAGKRLLLKRGQTWTCTNSDFTMTTEGAGIFGAWGTGDAPQVNTAGDWNSEVMFWFDCHDWRFMDIDFSGIDRDNHASIGSEGGEMSQLLFLRVNCVEVHAAFQLAMFGTTDNGTEIHSELFFVDCDCSGASQVQFWADGVQCALLGVTVSDGANHNFRTGYVDRFLVSHCKFEGNGPARHGLKIHGPIISVDPADTQGNTVTTGLLAGLKSQWIQISDNNFNPSTGTGWWSQISPENAANEQRIENVLIERNVYNSDSTTSEHLWVAVGKNIVFRNEIVNADNNFVLLNDGWWQVYAEDVHVYNVSGYGSKVGGLTLADVGSSSVDFTAKNNVLLSASYSGGDAILRSDSGTGTTTSSNFDTPSPAFATAAPALPTVTSDFELASGSPALDGGEDVEFVIDDFNGVLRGVGTTDAGAIVAT